MKNMRRRTNDIGAQQFYKFDKWILAEGKLKKLSPTAKLLYMVLRDREEISLKNAKAFTDEDGNLFQYFGQEKASELIGVSLSAIKKAFKDLQEYKLIESVRQGLGKPNRLYILDFEVSEDTIKELGYEEKKENKKAEVAPTTPANQRKIKSNKIVAQNGTKGNYRKITSQHIINQRGLDKYSAEELENKLLENQKEKWEW